MRTPLTMGAVLLGVLLGLPASSRADFISSGPAGINSQILTDLYGLTGTGIAVGQWEPGRPGVPGFDNPANTHPNVRPTAVFRRAGAVNPDSNITDHAVNVAGVLLSDHPLHRGVATGVSLYSSAFVGPITPPSYPQQLRALQHLALQNGGDVRAINTITGVGGGIYDGESLLTLGLDWSARRYDSLYVMARGNAGVGPSVPRDNFNGLDVTASRRDVFGVYREVWPGADFTNALDGRRLTNLVAPGQGITVPVLGGGHEVGTGTSFAAPHATGTVGLLQEFADARITAGALRWDANARRHEVMKAVLMNSADKLQDAGDGRLLGMEKTIRRRDGTTWLDTTSASATRLHPMDNELGTGQLNALRAFRQFEPGEWGPGNVPVLGWDYDQTAGVGDIRKYAFDTPLMGNSYVAITLAWDRLVNLDDTDGNGRYDIGESFTSLGLTNLDLFLVRQGETDVGLALWSSESTLYNVEHIFFPIPEEGRYEFWVRQTGASPFLGGGQAYAVAWQGVSAVPEPSTFALLGLGTLGLIACAWRRRLRQD